MKKKTKEFIIKKLMDEINDEYIEGYFDNPLDDYTSDLLDAAVDFIGTQGEWYDKYFLREKLEEVKGCDK